MLAHACPPRQQLQPIYVSKVQKIDDSIKQMHLNKNICFSFYIEAGPAYYNSLIVIKF